jgi:cytochrome c biogenesis protein ResB
MVEHNGRIKVIVALIGVIGMLVGGAFGSMLTYKTLAIPRDEVELMKENADRIHEGQEKRITKLEDTVPTALARLDEQYRTISFRLDRIEKGM